MALFGCELKLATIGKIKILDAKPTIWFYSKKLKINSSVFFLKTWQSNESN